MSAKNNLLWLWLGISFVVGLVVGGGGIYFVTGGMAAKTGYVSVYPPKASSVGNDWLVKLDGYAIRKSEFETGYKFYLSQIPEAQRVNINEAALKYQFLESLQAQYILTLKAIESGVLNTEEANFYVSYSLRDSIYKFYLNNSLPKDKNVFLPTKVQIEEYYRMYRPQFEKMGMKAEQIKKYAEQDIYNLNLQKWVMQFINSKKEEFKIEKNKENLDKIGISDTMPQLNLQNPIQK